MTNYKAADAKGLNRFLQAQESQYSTALAEIRNGRKDSHWIWYIFPQIYGLGISETSKFYAIKDIEEAKDYLSDDVLGKRLIEISNALLQLENTNASRIFGRPDDMKVRSSMTLFEAVPGSDPVFRQVLEKFYDGQSDEKTLAIFSLK